MTLNKDLAARNVNLLDEGLIPYPYSSCCTVLVGLTLFKKPPEALSFQIRSGWNLAGLFLT